MGMVAAFLAEGTKALSIKLWGDTVWAEIGSHGDRGDDRLGRNRAGAQGLQVCMLRVHARGHASASHPCPL